MSTTATLKPSNNQLWGIYGTDREYARLMVDPLRTVVEAPSKLAAEQAAAQLGFSELWAHPVTPEEAQRSGTLPEGYRNHLCQAKLTRSRGTVESTEENPARSRLRTPNREEEFSANLSKKNHTKKIQFLIALLRHFHFTHGRAFLLEGT